MSAPFLVLLKTQQIRFSQLFRKMLLCIRGCLDKRAFFPMPLLDCSSSWFDTLESCYYIQHLCSRYFSSPSISPSISNPASTLFLAITSRFFCPLLRWKLLLALCRLLCEREDQNLTGVKIRRYSARMERFMIPYMMGLRAVLAKPKQV